MADTAGLRAADDVVARIGIQRAAEAYVFYFGPVFIFLSYKWPCEFAESGTLTFHYVSSRYWT